MRGEEGELTLQFLTGPPITVVAPQGALETKGDATQMTALDVLQNVLLIMDQSPSFSLDMALSHELRYRADAQFQESMDKTIELLMAYADPFDTDTPTHRLYGRLYRWCRSVSLETQRDAVVWAISCLTVAAKPIRTADGREADAEDIEQWIERR